MTELPKRALREDPEEDLTWSLQGGLMAAKMDHQWWINRVKEGEATWANC